MGLFNKNTTALMDIIRCDEPSYLIWKWRPAGTAAGANRRENAIRWGSSLRVREGSVAVFVYSRPEEGVAQDYIVGPYDARLETKNLPVLASLRGLLYGGDSPFQAEVYFINLAELIQVKFGVPYFDLFDPRFEDFGVPVAVRGSISFRITDYQQFIRLHRLDSFDLPAFQAQIRDAVTKTAKSAVANAPARYNVPAVQIERQIAPINDQVEAELKARLYRDFGVTVSAVDISAIELDKQDEGYRQLMRVTREVSAAQIQAQAAVDIKNMQDTQRIEAEHMEGVLRSQREEAQYAQRLQTQSDHLAAHQLNQQAAVGIAGAEALGRMGADGATGTGGGLNPAAMMAGMAIGGAIGRNMAGMVNGMMGGLSQPVPPPVPAPTFYVAEGETPTGPFPLTELQKMAAAGALRRESLIWRADMDAWARAGEIPELQPLFAQAVPPEIPT